MLSNDIRKCLYLSCEVHHDEEQSFKKSELVLQHPDQRKPLHQELNRHHSAQLSIPGLLIAACAQSLHYVGEQRQLACLKKEPDRVSTEIHYDSKRVCGKTNI